MRDFKNLEHPICHSKGATIYYKKYKVLRAQLATYEDEVYDSWTLRIDKTILDKLDQPLLVRDPKDKTIKVNFAPGILATLKEVKHVKNEFPQRLVPETAQKLFEKFDDFRFWNNTLNKIVELYNYLKTDTSDKEYRLFEAEVTKIDRKMVAAEKSITWNCDDISDYIERLRHDVTELNERVRQSQDNIIEIYHQISQWEERALFIREVDGKKLLNIRDREASRQARYDEITQAGKRITELVAENESLFEVDLDNEKTKKAWSVYLRHLDNIVTDSLLNTVAFSLGYLLDETDVIKRPSPLFSTRLELSQPDIEFRPSLDKKIVDNFFDQTISLVEDIMNMASFVPRVSIQKNVGPNYMETIRKHPELKRLKDDFINRLETVTNKANDKKDSFLEYSHLWTESRQENLYFFLNYSRQVKPMSYMYNWVHLKHCQIAKCRGVKLLTDPV